MILSLALALTVDALATTAPAPTPSIAFDPAQAQPMEDVDDQTLGWLKPKRHRLSPNPYQSTDFTAYTLEWGEVKVGLAAISAGVLPRVQVGTVPTLNVLGIYNLQLKGNLLRVGPMDVALQANHYRLPMGTEFVAAYTGGGGMVSMKATRHWSVHMGAYAAFMAVEGSPDLDRVAPFLLDAMAPEVDLWLAQMVADRVELHARSQVLNGRVATDVRFNRRDSLVLQAVSTVGGHIDNGTGRNVDVPPIMGLEQAVDGQSDGRVPLGSNYTATASWQFSWKRIELRVGGGVSSVPGAWLLQSSELSYRMGGRTRATERRMSKGWRKNRRLARNGGDAAADG